MTRTPSDLDKVDQHEARSRRRFLIGCVIWLLGWEVVGRVCQYFGWWGF